jgi:hypothetical protein
MFWTACALATSTLCSPYLNKGRCFNMRHSQHSWTCRRCNAEVYTMSYEKRCSSNLSFDSCYPLSGKPSRRRHDEVPIFSFPNIVESTIRTNAIEQNLSLEDNSRAAIKKISRPLCYPKVHYLVGNNLPLDLESQETSTYRHSLYRSDPF